MIQYVLGFRFAPGDHDILLIRKLRPEWQHGLWNGIGGKVEQGEDPNDAMVREFREETGILTCWEDWVPCLRMQGTGATTGAEPWVCDVFRSTGHLVYQQTTDEEPHVWPLPLPSHIPTIPNLRWIIPLIADAAVGKYADSPLIVYPGGGYKQIRTPD